MTLLDEFRRLSRNEPCLVCGHLEWCMLSRDDPPSRAICQRVESKCRWKDAGWLHVLREADRRPPPRRIVIPARDRMRDFGDLAATYQRRARSAAVGALAGRLGVSAGSLQRLGIGWDGRKNWAFPMSDAAGLVRGIRLRAPNGGKFSVEGSKQGLHIPSGLSGRGPLLLPEGPTDTAAALDLGFDAVGRPSCRGAARLLIELIKKHRPEAIAVVADSDEAGRAGAAELAGVVACYCREVRVIAPPVKDLREWLKAGATTADMNEAIDRADRVRVRITCRGGAV